MRGHAKSPRRRGSCLSSSVETPGSSTRVAASFVHSASGDVTGGPSAHSGRRFPIRWTGETSSRAAAALPRPAWALMGSNVREKVLSVACLLSSETRVCAEPPSEGSFGTLRKTAKDSLSMARVKDAVSD